MRQLSGPGRARLALAAIVGLGVLVSPVGMQPAGAAKPPKLPKPTTTTSTTVPLPPAGNVCAVPLGASDEGINALLSSCPDGSTVRFAPKAVHHVDDSIFLYERNDLTFEGNGATITNSTPNDNNDNTPNMMLQRSDRITIRDLTLVGNFDDDGCTPPPGETQCPPNINRGSVVSNAGISVYGGTGVRIENVNIARVFGDGVTLGDAWLVDLGPDETGAARNHTREVPRDLRATNVNVYQAARHCLSVSQGVGIWFEHGTLDRCYLDGVDAEKDLLDDELSDIHFNYFRVTNYFGLGMVVPVGGTPDTAEVRGVEMRGNTFPTLAAAAVCNQAIVVGGYEGQRIHDVVVEGNTITAWKNAITLVRVDGGSVRGNTVTHDERARVNDCSATYEPDVVLIDSTRIRLD